MSKRTKRVLTVMLVIAVVSGIALIVVVALAASSYEKSVSSAFDGFLFKLESGELKTGDATTEVVGWPLPTTALVRTDHLDDQFNFLGYASQNQSLHFYSVNGTLFAAQYVEGSSSSKEKWYFCDMDLLQRYIELSRNEVEP